MTANANAQNLRRDGKFKEARAQLEICADRACPGLVQKDCIQRRDDLERAQPTLVFEAKDPDGHDLSDVVVSMDGERLAERLDGTALRADPGPHTFQFEAPGQPAVTLNIVLREGDVARHAPVVIGTPKAPPALGLQVAPPPDEPPPASPSPPTHPSTSTQILSITIGTAGLAGIGVGTAFGLMAATKWNNAKSECSSNSCPESEYAAASTNRTNALKAATVSTVAFIGGGALLVASGLNYFLAKGTPDSVTVAPVVGPGAAALEVTGRF